jgi:hypothetical protein
MLTLQIEEAKKSLEAEKPQPLRSPAVARTLTRERLIHEIENLTIFSKGPRLVLKVIARFNEDTKTYESKLGDTEVGNQYEVGKEGAIIGRELEETDKSTRILISSDESISRR